MILVRGLSKRMESTFKTAVAAMIDIAKGRRPLSHESLDELAPSASIEHLRSILVATAALPARDEHLIRLERWITDTLKERDDAQDKEILHRFAVWHLLRRLRARNRGTDTTTSQAATTRRQIRAAIALLDWLKSRGTDLPSCRQADLDTWISSNGATARESGSFVRWAIDQRINRNLTFASVRWTGPTGPLDSEERWRQTRRLIHDHDLNDEARFAGLVVLLYAQPSSTISQLTTSDVDTSGDTVTLRLGRVPVALPEPLASLARALVAKRRGHAVLGDQGTSRWLFPGGRPAQPVHPATLGRRLQRIGLQPSRARQTAMFELAGELPAAIPARTLGIHIKVAVEWQQLAAGDWARYAAEISRRQRAGSGASTVRVQP